MSRDQPSAAIAVARGASGTAGGLFARPAGAPRAIRAARLLAVTLAYVGSAKLGLALTFAHAGVSALRPAAGVALAAVLLGGYELLAAVALGAFLANVTTALPVETVLAITAGNTLEALIGALLLRKAGFRGSLRRLRDVAALVSLGGLASTAVGAMVGVAAMIAGAAVPHSAIALTWRQWWLSDMGGILVCGPALLLLAEARQLTRLGSFKWDLPSGSTVWSDELYRMLGRRREEHPPSYRAWRECIHPGDRKMVEASLEGALADRGACGFVHRVIHPDGQMGTIDCHARVEVDEEGEPIRMVGTCLDVTAFKLSEASFRSLLETAPDAMVIADEDDRIVLVNSQTERLFGYERDELIGELVELLVPERFAPDPHDPAVGRDLEVSARRKDGSEFPVEISLSPLESENGRLTSSVIRDVTERRLARDAFAYQARHDSLTGLPDRSLFLERLEHAIDRAERKDSTLAVLFLDIDDFKLVNDTLGHEAGDRLLVEMTPRLDAALRPGDTVARFGGDEFVVLCEDLSSEADAIRIAERIAFGCSRPVTLGPHQHLVTLSVGLVVVEGGASTATDLLRDADAAMYRAKAKGKARVERFDPSMHERLLERIALESGLRLALDRHEFRLHYQPVISLDGGEIIGIEALLRWQHPERGLLLPAQFMPVAESTGLIVPIGEWVIEEACRQAAGWRDARGPGQPPLPVSVNISPRQVARSELAASVTRILERTGLEAGLLDLEITESVLLDDAADSGQVLRQLKALGVRLILDDFGTGYSSLSYLKRFTIDALKIDRSFVDGLGRDPENGAIVNAVLSMARALDVDVTAEGVETPNQLALLRASGCAFAQGYLFSEPIPPEDVIELVDGALARLLAS